MRISIILGRNFGVYSVIVLFQLKCFVSLNFRQTKSWGYVTESGRFDGLVGDLQNKTVDFGGSPLFFKLDRLPFVDYGRRTWFLR